MDNLTVLENHLSTATKEKFNNLLINMYQIEDELRDNFKKLENSLENIPEEKRSQARKAFESLKDNTLFKNNILFSNFDPEWEDKNETEQPESNTNG